MLKFVGWRIAQAVVLLGVVSFLAFMMIHITPGDPAYIMLSAQGVAPSADLLSQTRHDMGLDLPLITQYTRWISGIFQGDWGYSYAFSAPVAEVLLARFGITLIVSLVSFVVLVMTSVLLGVWAACTSHTQIRSAIELIEALSNAIPTFWLGFVLIVIFGLWWHLLPAVGSLSNPLSFVLPVMALAFSYCGRLIAQIHSAISAELTKPYVLGLISRGISPARILTRHVVKNASAPVLNVVGLMLGAMLTGSITTEVVFSIPGMGMMILSAVSQRDYALILGYVILCAALFVLVNLIVDIVSGFVDPRVREGVRS